MEKITSDLINIVEINLGNFGSTGKIMSGINNCAGNNKMIVYSCYPGNGLNIKSKGNDIIISSAFLRRVNERIAYYSGYIGCTSWISTIIFLKKIRRINPQIIHLHNLHNSYINLPILFRFIKNNKITVVWTLHDCWAFTGQCPYFTMVKCDKWKTACHSCQQYQNYPASYVDCTKTMYEFKKKWFTGINNLTIVTPSHWLAGLVKQSFLKDYPIRVINNGINLEIFRPITSDFRLKNNISSEKHILLGVAFGWGKRKGLDVFIDLLKKLDGDKYQIVLVGTDNTIDKQLPSNIISIHRTQSQEDLAKLYSAADVFVNPTREDNFPTVNIEALACGTPVITFNTGGSPEILDETCGSVVPCDDVKALREEIIRVCENKVYTSESCIKRSKKFDMNCKYKEYIDLYKSIL